MRNIIHKVLSTILIAGAIGMITSAVYAGVIFVGDTENVGFKSAQKISPAVDFTCPEGKNLYNGKCVAKCDRNTYPQATALDEVKGTIASCTDVWGTYYTYTSCNNGWDLIEGDCIETDCSNFSYTSAPESIAGAVTSCKSGLKTFYKYLSCNEGWDFANGKCGVHSCSSTTYPYTSIPSSDAGTIVTCKTGAATQYGYSECRTGWDKNNGYCNIHTCDSNAFPFTSQPSNSIGTVVSCKTGNDVKYGYSACADDYELKNGQCEIKCAYTATSKPTGCATATDSCAKNGTTYYSTICSACSSGYTLSDGSCTACSWNGYTLSSCPVGATCSSDTCGGITKYIANSCGFGFDLNNGNCTLHSYAVGDIISYNGSNIGVVYHIDNNGYQIRIISLKYAGTKIGANGLENWQYISVDIPTINNISTLGQAVNDMDGKGNTDKLVMYSLDNESYSVAPAIASYNYAPTICDAESFCAQGKWYLPSLGELVFLLFNQEELRPIITSIGGDDLSYWYGVSGTAYVYRHKYYWSSTEADKDTVWAVNWVDKNFVKITKKTPKGNASSNTRPALQIDLCEINGSEYDSETEQCQ